MTGRGPETPPRLWRGILAMLAPAEAEGLVGDLYESFVRRSEELGVEQALRRYRADVVRSAPHLVWWRLRIGSRSVIRGSVVSLGASTTWFVAVYAVIATLSGRDAVLGGMSAPTYLTVWVFGAAIISGLVLRYLVRRLPDLERFVPGLVVATVVLSATDQPATLAAQMTVLSVALLGSAIGTSTRARVGT